MIVDIILILILLVFILSGYRKGLILSLCSLLILVISCLGASVAQEALTPRVVEEFTPQLAAVFSEKLEDQVSAYTDGIIESAGDLGLTLGGQEVTLEDLIELLNKFGIDVETGAKDTMGDVAAPLVEAAATTIAAAVLDAVAGLIIFLGAFLIIFLILRTLELGINTVDHLPVIHTLNHLGGGFVGLLSGAFLLTMLMAILSQTGIISAETFQSPVSGMLHSFVSKFI